MTDRFNTNGSDIFLGAKRPLQIWTSVRKYVRIANWSSDKIFIIIFFRVDFKNWKDEDGDEEEGQGGQDMGKSGNEAILKKTLSVPPYVGISS